MTSVSSGAEHPELQPGPCPEGKEQAGKELTDVRRHPRVLLQPHNNAEIYKVIQPHKENESHDFIPRLALARFIAKYPVFIDDEKQYMRANTRYRYSEPRLVMKNVVSDSVADVRSPKQNVPRNLQFYKLPGILQQRFFCFGLHLHA